MIGAVMMFFSNVWIGFALYAAAKGDAPAALLYHLYFTMWFLMGLFLFIEDRK